MVQELYFKSGLEEIIESLDLHQPGLNRGFNIVDVIEGFLVSVLLGARRMAHSEVLRHDEIIREIFQWKKPLTSQSTYIQFFRKYTMDDNDKIFPDLKRERFSRINVDKHSIDLDSTVIKRYGKQDCVEKGYNQKKHGGGSHHPLLCFSAELKLVVNAYMVSGDSASSTDMDRFITEMLDILGKEKIGLIRADSGFSGSAILERREEEQLSYIVAAKMTKGLVT